jgi:choline oxidase
MRGRYDYVVVGGGTAGAIVARRLAEDPSATVALVEAGPKDEGVDKIMRLARWKELLGDPAYGHDFRIEPQARGNGKILHSRGVMLGGCSSHNSAIAFVPPAYDFARWVEAGAEGWSMADVAPYFERVKARVGFERSDSGNAVVEAFIEAAKRMGFPERDFGCEVAEGVGWFVLNKRGELRSSSSTAYLHPLSELPKNLTLFTDTPALRLELQGHRATAVETMRGRLEAQEEVVLCAGAFVSPKLLLLSGIGPADELRAHGIEVRCDLPAVGEHLQDHPEGVIIFEACREVPAATYNHYEAGLFATVCEGAPFPDLMFHFGSEAFDLHTAPAGYPTAVNAFSLTPNVTRAKSEGVVRLRSSDPLADPVIDFRYFSDPEGHDEQVMLAGLELARELVRQPPLADWTRRELAPGADVTDPEELLAYARSTSNTVYHPVGTCRMGAEDDPEAVVTPELRVKGIHNLRVADASVFPFIVTPNPAVTCMMIGERCAELIRR